MKLMTECQSVFKQVRSLIDVSFLSRHLLFGTIHVFKFVQSFDV